VAAATASTSSCAGVDEWAGRLTPARGFDLLDDSFSGPLFLAITAAVGVAAVAVARYSARAEWQRAWA
jgi:hypothetical protein